ncbi:MAG TPA: hypothetical protein VF103_03060, partial [Polyangiaceae bacterium]
MRKRYGALSVLLALACNEVLGLDAGVLEPDRGGGGSLSSSNGGAALGPSNPSGNGGNSGNSGSSGRTEDGGDGGAGNDGGDDGPLPCASTADCIDGSLSAPPYLCLAGSCVDVLTEECDTLLGAEWLEDRPQDQPIIFGSIAEDVDERSASYLSLELAMKEFAAHGAVPIDGTERRPLLLVCHVPGSDPEPARRALDHLIDDVGVPGMLMLESRDNLFESVNYALEQKQADVFFVDVGGANMELGALDDGGRLWHMLGSNFGIATAFIPLVKQVEELVNPGASTMQSTRSTRLVIVIPTEDDGFETRMTLTVEGSIETNGQFTSDHPETYRLVYAARTRLDVAAKETAIFEPDIVIDFKGIYARIDTEVRARNGLLPFYLLPPSQTDAPLLLARVAADPTLRTRILGIHEAGPDEQHRTLYDAYLERFAAIAPDGLDAKSGLSTYEGAYFLLYATVAGGTGGTNMNRGMTRLLGLLTSERRDIGPTTIDSVIDLLGTAPSLSLHGALGPPAFYPYSGERSRPIDVWCIDEELNLI